MVPKRILKGFLIKRGFTSPQCSVIHKTLIDVLANRNDWLDIPHEDFLKALGTIDHEPVLGVEYKTKYVTVRVIETAKGLIYQRFCYCPPNTPPPFWRRNYIIELKKLDFINVSNIDLVLAYSHRSLNIILNRKKKP